MRSSRKIAYCAASTAIAVVCAIITLFSPAKLVPLLVCALCFYIAAISGGIGWGIISIVATALITFFAGGGVSMTAILLWVVFAPYSVLAYFIRKIQYRKMGILIRIAIAVVYANIALVAVYGLMRFVILSGSDLDIMGIINILGGYWVLAILASLLMISFDFLFVNGTVYVAKTLKLNAVKSNKANDTANKPKPNKNNSSTVDVDNSTDPYDTKSVDHNNSTDPYGLKSNEDKGIDNDASKGNNSNIDPFA